MEVSSDSDDAQADRADPEAVALYTNETLHEWLVCVSSHVPMTPHARVLRLRGPNLERLAVAFTKFVRWSLRAQKEPYPPDVRQSLPADVTIRTPVHPFAHMQIDRPDVEPYVTM